MKIAEMASFVMHFEANIAENYPNVYSSYGAIEALKVVDKVAEGLGEDALDNDYSTETIIDELRKVYTLGNLPAIDVWIEEYDNGVFYR